MGSVWRAEQVRLRSPAAVKFLDPSLIEYPEMQERFLQEARSAAAVQSAHVIQIFDYGREAGIPYIAMELLRGENLDARLARRGLLTPRELNQIFTEVARGLGEAHALGVIHRDVKPGNIFIARQGKYEVTKLIDFGIAKVRENALRVSQVTGTAQGTVLGTPQYMSPEQLRGRSDVDYRTDLWALGIIACECLTGRHPFPGATIGDLSVQICTEQPPAPSTLGKVPAGFDAWFFKATSKDPLDRFESAAAMSEALTKILVPPPEREAAKLDQARSIARDNWQELGRAWVAASRRASLLSRSVLGRARAGSAVLADTLRRRSLQLANFVRALHVPQWSRRVNAVGAAVVGALIVLGLVLWRSSHGSAQRTIEGAGPARAVLAASPRQVQSGPGAALREQERQLPVLEPEDLPPVVEGEDGVPLQSGQPSTAPPPASHSAAAQAGAAQRRSKKATPARAGGTDSNLVSPMSIAMGQLGARLAQGGEKRKPDPKPASPRAHKRAER
jgi:serine/threonine-protein kinase